jgi:hypothetical protein
MTVIIYTSTLYLVSPGDVITTYRTIIIPGKEVAINTSPSWLPTSVSIPSTEVIVSVTAVQKCNAPQSFAFQTPVPT